MGFKFSQHRGGIGFGVTSHGILVFPTTGGIGFGVTSHGIQVFPISGGIGFVVTSHGIQVFPTTGDIGFGVTSHGIQVFPTTGPANNTILHLGNIHLPLLCFRPIPRLESVPLYQYWENVLGNIKIPTSFTNLGCTYFFL